jgi:hypothetical protein
MGRRGNQITCEKFFLTPNPFWQKTNSKGWYKNSPIGTNEISKWTKSSAKNIGLDVKRVKITNHSNRAAAVTEFSRSGVGEQIKTATRSKLIIFKTRESQNKALRMKNRKSKCLNHFDRTDNFQFEMSYILFYA